MRKRRKVDRMSEHWRPLVVKGGHKQRGEHRTVSSWAITQPVEK